MELYRLSERDAVALETLSNMPAERLALPLDAPYAPHAWPGPHARTGGRSERGDTP